MTVRINQSFLNPGQVKLSLKLMTMRLNSNTFSQPESFRND